MSKEQITKAIADVAHTDWQPNGSRVEGYSIMLSKDGEYFCLNNIIVERLRMRLNTLDRLFNPNHKPLVLWRIKSLEGGIELRYIYGDESAYNYKERESVRLYDDSDGEPHDGGMPFAAYLFRVAYTDGIKHPRTDPSQEKYVSSPVVDLANDFVYDDENAQYTFDGQQLYDHIHWDACPEAQQALDEAVKQYRKYCKDNEVAYEKIKLCE